MSMYAVLLYSHTSNPENIPGDWPAEIQLIDDGATVQAPWLIMSSSDYEAYISDPTRVATKNAWNDAQVVGNTMPPSLIITESITCTLPETEADRRVAAQSIRVTREIVGQPALARYRPEEVRPGPDDDSDEALVRAAGQIGTTIFHPAGTAAMGSVVDAELRVKGVAALRVIDASVMPAITSGNTNAPVMMIAEKGAEMVLRSAR